MRITLLVAILLAAVTAFSNDAKYQPSEIQLLHLQLKQKDVQIAQQNVFFAQQQFKAMLQALGDEAQKVKAENSWPEAVVFDQESLTYSDPPEKR